MSRDQASLDALVTAKTRAAGSSFYWAMRLLETERRVAMYALYAFCRDADDIVDEPGAEDEKRRRLDDWVADLHRLYDGEEPHSDLAAALARHIRRYDLPIADFIAVIDGCRMDLAPGMVRPDRATLDLYCDRVASAVGRLSVRIFGDFRLLSLELANHQGRALQLTNILRDVRVDAKIGRLYLPDEILLRHGIATSDVAAVIAHPALPAVCADLSREAEDHFRQAREILRQCSKRAVRPAVVMMEMYWQIFRQCRARGWVPEEEPTGLPKAVKFWCAFRYGIL